MATLERQAPQLGSALHEVQAGEEVSRGATFRAVNDKLIQLYRGAEHKLGVIVCECTRPGCAEPLEVSLAEYEAAHASSSCFLVAPGHEAARGQRALLRTERFVVVEERPLLHALTTNHRETGNGQAARTTPDLSLVPEMSGADGSGA